MITSTVCIICCLSVRVFSFLTKHPVHYVVHLFIRPSSNTNLLINSNVTDFIVCYVFPFVVDIRAVCTLAPD